MSLQLVSLEKHYGHVKVLHHISLKADEGDFLVLLGGSGCGKSTLLNCIAGLEPVSAGRILIRGREVTMLDPSRRDVAMVFQSYALYPTMTVARNIGFALECARVNRAERQAAVRRVAALLQIDSLLDRKPSQLSGGQRQRVAIGRALVRDPDIFLLDEPMSNLDAQLRHQTRRELRDLHRKLNRTFVLVTHDQVEAMSMATKVAVLDKGHVQQFGTPYDLFYRPRNRFVAAFIGVNKMNFLDGQFRIVDGQPWFAVNGLRAPLAGYDFAGPVPEEGQALTLGIRPENIYRSRERLEGEHWLGAELKVLGSELTGSDVQAWFRFGDQVIAGRFRASRTPENGAMTQLYLDMRHIALFHAETGERL